MHKSDAWKQMMRKLKLDHIRASTPHAFEASGSYDMIIKPYTDRTANGLTRCIIDFLTFSGHYANRIGTQGQVRVQEVPRYNLLSGKVETMQKVSWTKGTTRKGTPDIDAVINGRAVKIEVKIGDDIMSEHQEKEQRKILAAGDLYFIARDMPSFLQWYSNTFTNP